MSYKEFYFLKKKKKNCTNNIFQEALCNFYTNNSESSPNVKENQILDNADDLISTDILSNEQEKEFSGTASKKRRLN